MSALPEASAAQGELARRTLLAHADHLLEEVEELRLTGQPRLPPTLGDAIRALQARIGRPGPGSPRTVRAAQLLVFAVQQRLMAANPHNTQPRSHLGRAGGMPGLTRLQGGGEWKELTLPPSPATGPDGRPWRAQVDLVVERAFDRWSLAQNQAVSAARSGQPAEQAVARAQAAWANYWELRCEAERLLPVALARSERSSAAVTGSGEAAIRAAKLSRKAPRVSSPRRRASEMTAAAAAASPGARTLSSWAAKSGGRA
jgi:hypothetical protein